MIELKEIISKLNLRKVIGSAGREIREPIQLNAANLDDNVIMWSGKKYYEELIQVKHGVIICEDVGTEHINDNCTYLLVDNPRGAFRDLLHYFFVDKLDPAINGTAHVDPTVKIGINAHIGAGVVIEKDCIIGKNVIIDHNTVIKAKTIIGNNVVIGSNNVIGGVGFGYERDASGEYVVIPHIGNVVIEDYVEIGNCTTIDRAVLGSTTLKKNSKVDNLVHIAHGVVVGENSLVIANAMVAGSVTIGKNVWVAPSSSILNKISIDDDALIGMGAVVLKPVEKGKVVIGNPGRILSKR